MGLGVEGRVEEGEVERGKSKIHILDHRVGKGEGRKVGLGKSTNIKLCKWERRYGKLREEKKTTIFNRIAGEEIVREWERLN